MTDPDDAYNTQPHDPGDDLTALAFLAPLAVILCATAAVAIALGARPG